MYALIYGAKALEDEVSGLSFDFDEFVEFNSRPVPTIKFATWKAIVGEM